MDLMEFLKGIPFFGGLHDDELEKVAQCLCERTYHPGEIIMQEGDQAKELFIIKSGQIEIFKEIPKEGCGTRIAVLQEGECFGEMSLIDIMPRSASVRALSHCQAMCLSYADFCSLRFWRLETFTMLVMNISREISRRLRLADSILAEYNIWWSRSKEQSKEQK